MGTRTPKIVGRYELGRTIGVGGFAKVKAGRNTETGVDHAVKIVAKKRLTSEDEEAQLLREIGITKLLRHTNVIRCTEVFQTTGYVFLVMDYIRGEDLLEKLKRVEGVGFGEGLARRYFRQLVSALRYCHGEGVFHRDVKPENILIDERGVLKLADFGLASVQEQTVEVCGSPHYVAPEVLAGGSAGYKGEMADAWSAGVLLYSMVAGRVPFDDRRGDEKTFEAIAAGRYRVPKRFSRSLRELLGLLLVTDPAKRAGLAAVSAHQWFSKHAGADKFSESASSKFRSPAASTSDTTCTSTATWSSMLEASESSVDEQTSVCCSTPPCSP